MNVDPRLNEIKDSLFRAATKAIIINDDKMLFVNEIDDEWWNLPGGGIEHGEEIEPSLVRELEEEISLQPTDILKIHTPAFVGTNAEMDGVPRLNVFYRVEVNIPAIKPGRDVKELKWCTADEILSMEMSPGIAPYAPQIAALLSA